VECVLKGNDVQLVGLVWDDYRQPYSPWIGLKTAVVIALMLILFVVYLVVRTRCHPACRHDAYLRLRQTVRSLTPSCLRGVRFGKDKSETEEEDGGLTLPAITVESWEECARRAELELTQVNDQNIVASNSVVTLQPNQLSVSDQAASPPR